MKTRNEMNGLVAVVTGGSSGIGFAAVEEFRLRGASVAILDAVVHQCASDVLSFECDITDSARVAESVERVAASYGRIDILVNNAGIGATGSVEDSTDAEWSNVLDVNVVGAARVSRAVIPHLRKSPSASIVNVTSAVALVGVPLRAVYTASKGAILSLTRAMAADLVTEGIRVNAVAPGATDTPWMKKLDGAGVPTSASVQALRGRQPIGRLVGPAEIARAIVDLADPSAGATTGTVVIVDGGMVGLRL
jgi:2-keto-3-deoxy-L-fuconate dehydrogenase